MSALGSEGTQQNYCREESLDSAGDLDHPGPMAVLQAVSSLKCGLLPYSPHHALNFISANEILRAVFFPLYNSLGGLSLPTTIPSSQKYFVRCSSTFHL